MVGRDTGNLEAVGERADVVSGRHFDDHLAEAEGVLARTRAAAVPDIHGHVVVVAARGNEQGLPVPAGGLLEAQGLDVEVMRGPHVAYLEVDMPDAGARLMLSCHRSFAQVLLEVALRRERQAVHNDRTAVPLPSGARLVVVELDPVALGVGEVEGFADQVVGTADEGVGFVLRGRGNGCSERGLVFEEQRGVEESCLSAARDLEPGGGG